MIFDQIRQAVGQPLGAVRDRILPKPVDYTERTAYRPPPAWYRRVQRLIRPVFWLGLPPEFAIILEVKGRRSGETRRVALVRTTLEGRHYLVSISGESSWVRNVRAANGEAVIRRRKKLAVQLVEVPVEERPLIIEAYLKRSGRAGSGAAANEARYYFGLEPNPSRDEIAEIAGYYPVFEITPRKPRSTEPETSETSPQVRSDSSISPTQDS